MRLLGILLAVVSACWLVAQTSPAPKSVLDGAFTEAQAKRGETVANKECANCHGEGLSGGEAAPPLDGSAFLSNWSGLTVGDLFDRIRKSMPQDDPSRLTRQQDADVIAYVLSLNRFPAGKSELVTQIEVLKGIKIESPK